MPTHKVFLNGPLGGGKTETIKSVSDLPLVSVLKKLAVTQTAVSLDYGRVHIDSRMIYLYAPAQGTLEDREWLSVANQTDGLVYVVDGATTELRAALTLFEDLVSVWHGPTVVGINGVGRSDYSERVYSRFTESFGSEFAIVPYSAVRKTSSFSLFRIVADLFDAKDLASQTGD